MGPFHKRQKKHKILCGSKRSSFITDFFELQFDTLTLIIPSLRMAQARGCRGSNLIYSGVLRNHLVPDRIYMQHYYQVYSSTR